MTLEMFTNLSDTTSKENAEMQCTQLQKSTSIYKKFSVKLHSICNVDTYTHTSALQKKSHTVSPLNNKTANSTVPHMSQSTILNQVMSN